MDGAPRVWKQHTQRNAPDTGPFASIFILVEYRADSGLIVPLDACSSRADGPENCGAVQDLDSSAN
jgi:hypothetical protein